MNRFVSTLAVSLCLATAAHGESRLDALAAKTAATLAEACPKASPGDMDAFSHCSAALRGITDLPFVANILWGGDQPALPMKRKNLTDFRASIFQRMYLPLFSFTGKWTIRHDDLNNADVIRIEAFFRNDLPAGEYPYPFWHSAAKWTDYEAANELDFYTGADDQFHAVTRARLGDEAARGAYAHHEPPVFDGKWQWVDDQGHAEPKPVLFASQYSAGNPYVKPLDQAYTGLAMKLRDGTCMECHTPANKAGATHLVIFQTPMHAAGAIDQVLRMVKAGEMPQDEWGQKVSLDDKLKAALLKDGEVFRRGLANADAWEARHHGKLAKNP